MELFTSFPVIPIVTFVLIAGFFGYQLKLYLKERKKASTPSVPNLGQTHLKDNSAQFVNKVAAAAAVKPPVHKKLQPFNKILGGAVIMLLLVSSIGFFYVFQQGEKLSFVPRANIEPTSPLLPLSPTQSITSAPAETLASPTVGALSPTSAAPTASETTPAVSPTASSAPTSAPTQAAQTSGLPTPTSTLLAYYNTNVYPTNTPTPTPQEEATPTPTPSEEKGGSTPTPKPKKEIPKAGVSLGSILLITGSVVLLTLGFAL